MVRSSRKTVKNLLSNKPKSSEKITVVHESKIITNDVKTKPRYLFFCNAVKHLKIPEFKDIYFSAEYICHPTLK